MIIYVTDENEGLSSFHADAAWNDQPRRARGRLVTACEIITFALYLGLGLLVAIVAAPPLWMRDYWNVRKVKENK